MNKADYFNNLNEIIIDTLFIGKTKDDLKTEIANNTWGIGITNEVAARIETNDFILFLNKVIQNREHQITQSTLDHGMLFYVWVDHLAGQLRLNLISDYHTKLPFGCDIEITDNLESIITEFILSPFLNGIPIQEQEEVEEPSNEPFLQRVYLKTICK
ncbi:hypothetical protein [Paenibacillus antri]|uniref:hypothetical protein n=1 Tax=Paenibacillus antri TaxID=2582848 RepID=UPI00192E6F18|nr:hypothetical protein [Paenibacillus antri]